MALRLRDQHVFMWQSAKMLNVFSTLTLKQIFWKAKAFFRKMKHFFLVEGSKIENTSFPYKTETSEANVKTNKMVTTKWTYHKERSFASNYVIFLLYHLYSEFFCCTNDPNALVCTFCKRWSFIWLCFFHLLMNVWKFHK